MSKYAKDESGVVITDAEGRKVKAEAYENEPSERMADAAKRNTEKEPLEDFLRRIGWPEEEIKKRI